jgi:hypothetical protein
LREQKQDSNRKGWEGTHSLSPKFYSPLADYRWHGFCDMNSREAAQRWPSAAAGDQHSISEGKDYLRTCYRAVSCKALLSAALKQISP